MKPVDVILEYSTKMDGAVVETRSETLAVETSISIVRHLKAPSAPGSYSFEAVAKYDDLTASSSAGFNVPLFDLTGTLPFYGAIIILLAFVVFLWHKQRDSI